MRNFCSLFLALALCSCAPKIDVIQTGPWETGSADWKDIPVFSSKAQIKKTWIAVALFHGAKVPRSDRDAIRAQIKEARKKAAAIGADAVLLVETDDMSSYEPLSYVSGVAVKYADAKKPAE